MATLKNLKAGQVLFDVRRVKCGNTTVSRGCLYEVRVISLSEDGKSAMVSWNGNSPRRYHERDIKRLRVNRPKPKGTMFGSPTY